MTFRLNRVQGGSPAREHLEAIERKTGIRPKELDECEMPRESAHVWEWFLDLHSARSGNGYGPNPISYMEIWAWAKLKGIAVRAHEADMLRALDAAYLEEALRNAGGKQ
jgi:hypothetical protein